MKDTPSFSNRWCDSPVKKGWYPRALSCVAVFFLIALCNGCCWFNESEKSDPTSAEMGSGFVQSELAKEFGMFDNKGNLNFSRMKAFKAALSPEAFKNGVTAVAASLPEGRKVDVTFATYEGVETLKVVQQGSEKKLAAMIVPSSSRLTVFVFSDDTSFIKWFFGRSEFGSPVIE